MLFVGSVQQRLDAVLEEERAFNIQYQQWKQQFDDWIEQNQSESSWISYLNV